MPDQNNQPVTGAQLDAALVQFEDRLVARLRGEGAIPEIDHEIVDNDGPYYWTRGSVKLLPPGRRFLGRRSFQFCKTEEDFQLVMQNCGLNRDGTVNPGARFGDGFAQADSNLTPRLQGAVTSQVHPVKQLGFGFILDRTRVVTESEDNFPLTFAFHDLDDLEELQWVRLTAEHLASVGGGWKAPQP
jgi:hypothetical protein